MRWSLPMAALAALMVFALGQSVQATGGGTEHHGATPSLEQLRAALSRFVDQASPEVRQIFFSHDGGDNPSPPSPSVIKQELLRKLDADTLTASATHPMRLFAKLMLYRGHFFLDQHYPRTIWQLRGRPDRELDRVFRAQPWLELQPSGELRLRRRGAARALGATLGAVRLQRATEIVEGDYLLAVRDLLRGKLDENGRGRVGAALDAVARSWSMPPAAKETLERLTQQIKQQSLTPTERRRAARFLVGLIHIDNRPRLFCMPEDSMESFRDDNRRQVVLSFALDFRRLPRRVLRGTYFGTELRYLEVNFHTPDAILHAIRHLEGEAYRTGRWFGSPVAARR